MTKIYYINPRSELLIHGIAIYPETDILEIEKFVINLEKEQGPLERVIVSMNMVRIMDIGDKIPKPTPGLLSGKTGNRL